MMICILSPAKIMRPVEDFLAVSQPVFMEKQHQLLSHLQDMTYDELKAVFQVSDKVAKPVYDHYQALKEGRQTALYPAILAYQGIAYQYMAPQVFTDDMFAWVQKHLRILSGMYGLLKPLDGITLYRLEMHSKCPFSLYEFWGKEPADAIEADVIVNLASEEYAKLIRKYRKVVDVRFLEPGKNGWKETAVHAKMARGRMVRYLAQHNAASPEAMKGFDELGYIYSPEQSSPDCYVFLRP
jgi:hypothetical protein